MRYLVSILLFMFITCQVLPVVIAIIDDEVSISKIENSDNDEITKELKELKINYSNSTYTQSNLFFTIAKPKIISKNQLDFDLIPSEIFLTPPELS